MGVAGIFVCFLCIVVLLITLDENVNWDVFHTIVAIIFVASGLCITLDASSDMETKTEIIITNNFNNSSVSFISDVDLVKIEKTMIVSKCSSCVFGEKTTYKILEVIKPNVNNGDVK